jgi:hypothetical protein
MVRLSFLLTCFFFLLAVEVRSSKDWRGLVPLKSTRADVERVLGPPKQNIDKKALTYYLSDVVVLINFSGNPKCQESLPYDSWDVGPDTITGLAVMLKKHVPVSESGIDLTKFKKARGASDIPDHFYYSHPEDGFAVEVQQDYVVGYIYRPTANQQNSSCRSRQ